MDETTAPGSPHDLLLRLAGRVDDDLLADARELVAVGEDGHALELVTAALAAEGAALTPSVRSELVTAARTARIDLDVEAALAPPASDTAAHRFSAQSADDAAIGEVVRQLPDRVRDGVRLRLAWRLTPAGSAPGPLPHAVLLVETPEGGRPAEVLAYQISAALTRGGVHAAVEVLTSGRPMPAYHAAALRDSVPLDDGAPPVSPRGASRGTSSSAELVDSVVAEVVEEVTAGRRSATLEAPSEVPVDMFAAEEPAEPVEEPTGEPSEEPAPRPVPMRTWPGGRRRRVLDEPTDDQEQPEEHSVTSIARPLPSPVPLARRVRPGPAPRPADADTEADAGAGGPTAASGGPDPLSSPLRPPLDPLLDPMPPAPTPSDESEWEREWASGDWAVSEPAEAPFRAPAGSPADTDTPVEGMPRVAASGPAAPVPFGTAPSSGSDNLFTSGPPAPAPQAQTVAEPGLLKPESLARLSDADRELLARLQAELVASPPNSRGANGAHALREPGPPPHAGGQNGGGMASADDPNGIGPAPGGQAQPGLPGPPDLAG